MKNKGITLVALVITIIILLILAGITLNLTLGQNGIITKAQQAGRNYMDAAQNEQTQLAYFLNEADNMINNSVGNNPNGSSSEQDKKRIAELEKQVEDLTKQLESNPEKYVTSVKFQTWNATSTYCSCAITLYYNDGSSRKLFDRKMEVDSTWTYDANE